MDSAAKRSVKVPTIVFWYEHGVNPVDLDAPGEVWATANRAVLGTLLELDETHAVRPSSLESYSWDRTSGAIRLQLKPNLYFHNGRKVTADDLVFSLVRSFFSKRTNLAAQYLDPVLKKSMFPEQLPTSLSKVGPVQTAGNDTVVISTKVWSPEFFFALTRTLFSLVPREALEADLFTWKTLPVGVGPFSAESFLNNKTGIALRKLSKLNPNSEGRFHILTGNQPPSSDEEVILNLGNLSDPLKTSAQWRLMEWDQPAMVTTLFFFNRHPLVAYPEFRRALSKGLDRGKLAAAFGPGTTPTQSYLPLIGESRKLATSSYSLDDARAQLKHVPNDLLNRPLRIGRYAPSGNFSKKQVESNSEWSRQFEAMGLRLEFEPYTSKVRSPEEASRWLGWLAPRIVDQLVPEKNLVWLRGKPLDSLSGIENCPTMSVLFKQFDKSQSADERWTIAHAISKDAVEHAHVIPLFSYSGEWWVNSSRVASLGLQPSSASVVVDAIRLKD